MFARHALQSVLRHQKGAVCRGVYLPRTTARSFCATPSSAETSSPLEESLHIASEDSEPVSMVWKKIEVDENAAAAEVKVRVLHDPEEAVHLCLGSEPKRNFMESVDVAVNLNVDPRKADQIVRGTAVLPHGNGNTVRVLVFAKGDKAQEALDAGADLVGAEDMIERIQDGFVDFDRTVATPDMMGLVGKVARKLGPRQLMPNPKMGTITSDIAAAVKTIKAGQVQFKVEKKGILHACIGKKDFTPDKILDNLKSFMYAISSLKPEAIKGQYIKSVSISSTMGPGYRISVPEIDPSSSRFKA